jgi:chromate transporter
VGRRRWLTLDQHGLAVSLAKVTPGTGILAFSAATAWMLARWTGAVVAVLAVSVPSAIVVVLLTWTFTSLGGSAPAAATLAAILASAIGMMWAAAWLLIRPQIGRANWLRTLVVVVGAFTAMSIWSISPVQILIGAAVIGFCWTSADRE